MHALLQHLPVSCSKYLPSYSPNTQLHAVLPLPQLPSGCFSRRLPPN
jgi:hypothetical protein